SVTYPLLGPLRPRSSYTCLSPLDGARSPPSLINHASLQGSARGPARSRLGIVVRHAVRVCEPDCSQREPGQTAQRLLDSDVALGRERGDCVDVRYDILNAAAAVIGGQRAREAP